MDSHTQSLPSKKNASCKSTIFGCLQSDKISISIIKSERSSSPSRAHIFAAAYRFFSLQKACNLHTPMNKTDKLSIS